MDTQSINLDDIFPVETAPTRHAEHAEHFSSTTTRVEKTSSYSSTTVVQNSHSSHSVEINAVTPPEPKCRTSLSGVSETKESHVEVHNTSTHLSHGSSNDDLLASVFGAVKLPDVHYGQDHHHAIQHIDDALAGEETDFHYDGSSVVSESHQSSVSTHRTANGSVTGVRNASNRVAESLMQQAMDDLHLAEPNDVHDQYADEPATVVNQENGEENGAYEPYSMYSAEAPPRVPSRRGTGDSRMRTMTYDSAVSGAESRVGGFDVHHDDGTYTAEEINLHHDEVAYTRPKLKDDAESPSEGKETPFRTGDTMKLKRLNEEVVEARQRQAELAAQVERERAEVEKLRQLKQQSLAREAAARVHPRQFSMGSGVSVGSNSTTKNSSTVQSDFRHASGDTIYDEEPVKVSTLAQRQLNNGKTVSTIEGVNMVVPEMEVVKVSSKNSRIRKVIIGGDQAPSPEDKTILLFGPTKSGKTMTINSMLNYLYDVKRENDFRFVLDGEIKRTENLTAYVINNTVLPFSVTVVDTPGVVSREGNATVSTLIKTWFEQELREAGTFRLDAISIVLHHNEKSLGWPFINELAAVKHMLGDDLKTNVLPIITNSEVLPQPIAVRSLALANISFVEYYKLNNLGFMPNTQGIPKLQHNLFFSHGMASLEAYFRDLQELIHPLLAILRGAERSSSIYSYSDSDLY